MQTYAELYGNKAFRRFWFALLLALIADEAVRTTLVWQVYAATRSSAAVGSLMFFLTAPVIVGGIAAGWLLDRYPRATVLSGGAVGRGILLMVIAGALLLLGPIRAILYAAALLQGALLMMIHAGAPSAIADIVSRQSRSAANAMETMGFAIAGVVGPLAASQLLLRTQSWAPLALAGMLYLAFGLLVGPMQLGAGRAAGAAPRGKGLRDSGLLHPAIVAITIMFVVYNVGLGLFAVGLPMMVDTQLRGSPALYGAMQAATGIGTGLGALGAGVVSATAWLGVAIVVAQSVAGIALVGLAQAGSVVVALGIVAVFGVCAGVLTVWAQTVRMQIVAPQWRGRAFATLRMVIQTGRPAGSALGGAALLVLALPAYFAAAGALIGGTALVGLLIPALRRIETPLEAPPLLVPDR